ncbi:MAG: MaoC family dehydratase N-terminal domain-containing protein [Deltaproteobacteria bacterium]|nr:MaoC family dehydratase N-terminal domain-containing protein [Deltaproteobacteria bacterium]
MSNEIDAQIDEFIARTGEMTGSEVREREPWNTEASADAIRHFAYGTDDGNPLWLDPVYAAKSRYKKLVAPPAFLVSVLYPILHGAPMEAPLSSLIGGVEFEWFLPVLVGDQLRAKSIQKEMYEKKSSSGRRLIFVISECTYWNQNDAVVAKATGTMIRATQVGTELLFERPIHRYNDRELEEIGKAFKEERRTGAQTLYWDDISVGQDIPPIVRGPLTIGDMVCWNAALGPAYKAGRLGYLDLLKAPHAAVRNPVTGWKVKYSQQHEDFNLASQRGMPGPFDNGVMRFAWVAPLVTNWMGDESFLRKLYVQVKTPNIYGDTTWYRGKVVEKSLEGKRGVVKLEIAGVNQVGITTTGGWAEVVLPARIE